jgi:hypothetical protein
MFKLTAAYIKKLNNFPGGESMSCKRVFPYVLAVIAAGAAFFLVSCGSDTQKTVAITKTTESPQVGVVNFPHEAHGKAGVKCVECHHKVNNAERDKVCANCHFGEEGINTMHKLCVDCHISAKKGPRQCDGCHTQQVRKE